MIWMILSMLVAGAAVVIQQAAQKHMRKTKGDFLLKYDVNIPVRLSALQQWLSRQFLVQARTHHLFSSAPYTFDRNLSRRNSFV
jgi:hypothetical protein